MRKVKVPVDMASEQKVILGILSKRQMIYIAVGGGIAYWYVPIVFNLFPNVFMGSIASLISALPLAVIVFVLGFTRKEKYHLNFDRYLYIKLQYRSQQGNWRK
ncbi:MULTISPECIES: PrgI family protein [Metabacillus]|uniref:PrgI family protein n=1 Tax=Metabacillus TaxID=2675233 RepID=UPI000C7F871C|nr:MULTISPECIES: PrgI family protein [Metabacillus]MCM3443611.1 PrgI family protein [Metabacillus halosaccharovorans]PMC34230.1 PrgI family protein [Bacillus sp. UMB0899]